MAVAAGVNLICFPVSPAKALIVCAAAAVEALSGPLYRDILEASEECWRYYDRPLQLRGRLGLGKKTVRVREPQFDSDIERRQLGGALEQWQEAAVGVGGAAALDIKVAEERLRIEVGRWVHLVERAAVVHNTTPCFDCMQVESSTQNSLPASFACFSGGSLLGASDANPAELLYLLDSLLHAHHSIHGCKCQDLQPTLELVQQLALSVGSAATASAFQAQGSVSVGDLAVLLASHDAETASWAAALLQPSPQEVPLVIKAIGSLTRSKVSDTLFTSFSDCCFGCATHFFQTHQLLAFMCIITVFTVSMTVF